MEGTDEADAPWLGLSEVRVTGAPAAAALEGAGVEVSAGGRGSAEAQTQCFRSASQERRGVCVTTDCYINKYSC